MTCMCVCVFVRDREGVCVRLKVFVCALDSLTIIYIYYVCVCLDVCLRVCEREITRECVVCVCA